VGYPHAGQDQEAGIGDDAGKIAAASGLTPANPLVPILKGEAGRLEGGGAHMALGALEEVALLRPAQGLVTQGVLGHELTVGVTLRRRRYRDEVDGAQGGQVAVHVRCDRGLWHRLCRGRCLAGGRREGRRRWQGQGAGPVELGQRPPGTAQTGLAAAIGPAQPVTHPLRQGAPAEGGLLSHRAHDALA